MPGKYQRIIERVFEQKLDELEGQVDGPVLDEDIPFHRDDLEEAMEALGIEVKNVPDIPYAYRSRRPLPEALSQHGYSAIILDDNRPGEEPTYLFTKRDQLIPVPDVVDETRTTTGKAIPKPVQEYVGKDEQGVLTQVRYADLLDDFTGLNCYHLTSHLRFRVQGREAELDDLYIGVNENGEHHVISVEAKGEGETLNRNQLIRNTRGMEEKSEFPDDVQTLAVKLHEGEIYLFEFEVYQEGGDDRVQTERVWKYEFKS